MTEYEFLLCSSLEKVFPDKRPTTINEGASLSLWRGSRGAVQLVYRRMDVKREMPQQYFKVDVLGASMSCQMRNVRLIPSDYPCYGAYDPYYITTKSGLFPDLLEPVESNEILPLTGQYRSLWLSWDIPEDAEPGKYQITVRISAVEKKMVFSGLYYEDENVAGFVQDLHFTLKIGNCTLTKQSFIHTEWFHVDCLANYYGTQMYDAKHWEVIDHFMEAAHRHGINMLLTPIFTPPLDTPKNGVRRISQLIGIERNQGSWTFDFEKLKHWVTLCKKHSIPYLEIGHFFTQWGAEFTPNIVATVDGHEQRIFGWDHPATGQDYNQFLHIFIPQLREQLNALGYDDKHVFYHVSDEPSEEHLKSYQAARNIVKDLIPEEQIIDALSCVEFYKKGIVPRPIPGSTEIQDFYDEDVQDLWVYYCCAQAQNVPNRFFAQTSSNLRIMGVLMYLYDIKGFLHWGFNFYNSKFSGHPIDPYICTHGDYGYPSGDPFIVYPGANGEALDSLRAEVQDEGFLDFRALQTLESLVGRKQVEALIYKNVLQKPITFRDYPRSSEWLLALRELLAAEIEEQMIKRFEKSGN